MIGAVDDGKTNAVGAIAATQAHLERGEALAAYNEAQEGLASWPGHPRLRQLQALALARSGDTARANAMLQELAREGVDDAETLGVLARTHKDLALDANGVAVDRDHLDAAFGLYRRAYENAVAAGDTNGATYAGINAATLALVRGERDVARTIAAEVRRICATQASRGDYWSEATLGEAALILGEYAVAAAHYRAAADLAKHRFGDKASTRRQSRVLLRHLPGAPADVAKALTIAPIVAFTGHMMDRADRATPRFPASLESAVRAELRSRLAAIAPAAVYASAACGADLLCLETARELGVETHIVLPFPAAEFRRVSVDFAGNDWSERFERELANASSVTVTSDHYASGSAATFEYANLILTGAARLRAQQLDTSVKALAVSDAGATLMRGGTAWTIAQWKKTGIETDRIALEALRGDGAPEANEVAPVPPARVRHELRAMLFADAVGYSKLGEDQIPNYIEGFLGAVGKLARTTHHPYEHVEVAGDGLYMVFATVEDAGHFALELSQLANAFDRDAWSLPPQFNLRIALHCGPVHCARDPITGGPLYTGPHTSRTARIEPITPPGQVYASSAFASVAAALGTGFALSYVGRMPLAKGYGTLGLYHLRGFAVGRSPM
jgi:MAP3K TRAFs-binding domain/Adenylate and Guanylate cyclase catalytic domain